MPRLAAYDLYRRIPHDLTSPTAQGGLLSVGCVVMMLLLFTMELWDYMSPPLQSYVVMDEHTEPQIRINFDITALEMPCDWVELDVKDRLGVNRVNIVPNIKKHLIKEGGKQWEHIAEPKPVQARPRNSFEEMEQAMAVEGESPHVDGAGMKKLFGEKKFVFIDFYAPWCIWCKRLAPVWQKFADEMHSQHYHVEVRKVDCVQNPDVCSEQRIRGFPTLRLFKHGTPLADFSGERTVEAMVGWAGSITGEDEEMHHYRHVEIKGKNEEHLGCRFTGYILVNRVPGNFHLQAKSDVHSINPKETNLSHVITELSFGDPMPDRVYKQLPADHKVFTKPLNRKVFASEDPSITFDHYMKVVSTKYELGWGHQYAGYQMQYSNHQYLYEEQHADDDEGKVPEARFSYDFSPTAVVVKYGGKRWYDFITSLCAIIGGVFTMMGLIDRSIHGVRSRLFKDSVGKLG
eukprot:Rhum_TRINITY_DN20951_c0_g1::Rhum_TRINITY_DN20951_c0_g1_i1::g.172695::m.172695